MQEIALASDSQLRSVAQSKALNDYANSPKRSFEYNFATALPIMDSFLVGATKKGNLKQKALAGGKQLKDWGIFLVAANLYNKAINKIVSKSETLQNFKENSPFAYTITNALAGTAVGISAIKYANKGYQKFIAPIIPEKVKQFGRTILGTSSESSVSGTINNGMKTFAKKYPKITKSMGTVAKWAMPVLCLGFMASIAYDMIKAKVNENRTYKNLEDARLSAAQQLAFQNKDE